MTTDTASPESTRTPQTAALGRLALLIAATVSVNIVGSALGNEKLNFLYKDALRLNAGQVATLAILVSFPNYLRPVFGAISDLFPLFGFHRRSYYLLAALLQSGGIFALSTMHHYTYLVTALSVMVLLSGGVLLMVISDAVMVSVGNATGQVGRLQTIQQFMAPVLTILFAAHLSGYVTQHWSYQHCFRAAALVTLLAVPLTWLIHERRIAPLEDTETASEREERLAAKRAERAQTSAAVRNAAKSPALWAVVGYVFYLIITPGVNTAQFFYQVDYLHFSKQLLGDLTGFSAAGGVVGVLVYAAISPRLSARTLVWGALAMDAASYLLLMALRDPLSAKVIGVVGGFFGSLYLLSLLSLAARACPKGVEAAVYGLVTSAIGLGGTLGEKIGSTIYDNGGALHGHIAQGWHALLWAGFGLTILGAVFIPFLPAWTKSSEASSATGSDPTPSR